MNAFFSSLGVVMDNLVLRYYWNNLTSNLKLKTQKGLKSTPTAIGAIVFHTRTNDTLKRWSIFLKSFFDNNRDNEPVILALAEKNLTSPVSIFDY